MKINFDKKSLIVASVYSLLTLTILIVGLTTKVDEMSAFAATIVFQFGIALLWILSKLGAFAGMFSSTKKIVAKRNKKFKEKHNIPETETKKMELKYIGPISMIIFGFIEVIIYIMMVYI